MATLKAIKDVNPGTVVYLRPDHHKYDGAYFAILRKKDEKGANAVGSDEAHYTLHLVPLSVRLPVEGAVFEGVPDAEGEEEAAALGEDSEDWLAEG